MTKPIKTVTLRTLEGKSTRVKAMLDTGSYHTIVRKDALPPGTAILPYRTRRRFRTAAPGARLDAIGYLAIQIEIAGKRIETMASVAPDLPKPLVIGARTMQEWDISIKNDNGHTRVVVRLDMRDPDVEMIL